MSRVVEYKEITKLWPYSGNGISYEGSNENAINYYFPVCKDSTYTITMTKIGNRLRASFITFNPNLLSIVGSQVGLSRDIYITDTIPSAGYSFSYKPSINGYIIIYVSNEGAHPQISITSDGVGGDTENEAIPTTYSNIQEAIDAGSTNMYAVRNNSANDDSTDTINLLMDWFKYNGTSVSSLYVSGNSWIGFGASSEHLKVNRRDAKVYYEYLEVGTIGKNKFIKLRWQGYSRYNYTSESYKVGFDVFLFDNGEIYLNWFNVPTSSCDGISALVCGSQTVSYTAVAGTSCEWTFTPSDTENGKDWVADEGRPNLNVNYKPQGEAVFSTNIIRSCKSCANIKLVWEEEKPEQTDVKVYAKLNSTDYVLCENDKNIGCVNVGQDLSNETLYIKVELSTEDSEQTPKFGNLKAFIFDTDNDHIIVLNFASGNRNSVQNANEFVTIEYVGGTLVGIGGAVLPFEILADASLLKGKINPHDVEHVEISNISAMCQLRNVSIIDVTCDSEHVEISSIIASAVLTNVDDL